MKEQLQQQQTQWEATLSQQQEAQTALETALNLSIAELRQQLATVDQQTATAHADLKTSMEQALKDHQEDWTRNFATTILLALAAGAGILIFL